MKESELRKELHSAGSRLAKSGLVHSNLGTISLVIDREKNLYLTKPGPVHYLLAKPKDFVRVNLLGKVLQEGRADPSLNWLVHAECYRRRPDIGAIVHAHPRHVVILTSQSSSEVTLRLLTGEATWFVKPVKSAWQKGVYSTPGVPVVENLPPLALAGAVGREILRANVVAIRNHGIIAVGKDIREATAAASVIEEEAAVVVGIYAMGGVPDFLSPEKIWEEVHGMPPWFSKPYGAV